MTKAEPEPGPYLSLSQLWKQEHALGFCMKFKLGLPTEILA